jgi:hypothetical protein
VVVQVPLAPDRLDDVTAAEAALREPSTWRRVDGAPSLGVQLRPGGFRGIAGLFIINGLCAPTGSEPRLIDLDTTVARATVSNPLDVGVPDVEVAAIAVDQEGRIVGGRTRTIALGPRSSAEAVVPLILGVPFTDIARIEVTAAYAGLDLGSYER